MQSANIASACSLYRHDDVHASKSFEEQADMLQFLF